MDTPYPVWPLYNIMGCGGVCPECPGEFTKSTKPKHRPTNRSLSIVWPIFHKRCGPLSKVVPPCPKFFPQRMWPNVQRFFSKRSGSDNIINNNTNNNYSNNLNNNNISNTNNHNNNGTCTPRRCQQSIARWCIHDLFFDGFSFLRVKGPLRGLASVLHMCFVFARASH